MASAKEAFIICLDVGPSMRRQAHDFDEATYLDVALECISWILQKRIFQESKDEIGMVLFGTTATDNPLAADDQYESITVFRDLRPVDWDFVKKLESIPENCVHADFVDALVVSLDALHSGSEDKKFAQKNVVLFSILDSEFADDQIEQIVKAMQDNSIDFTAIGPSITDEEDETTAASSSAPKNKKTGQQKTGEKVIKGVMEALQGTCYPLNEALPTLSHFSRRQVKPTAWKCNLEISGEVRIPICMYLKTKEYKLKQSWKLMGMHESNEVQKVRTYHKKEDEVDDVEDDNSKSKTVNGGNKFNNGEDSEAAAVGDEVEKDEVVKAFKYGTTLVPIDKLNMDSYKYKTEGKCLQLLSFTSKVNVPPKLFMGDGVHVLYADVNDPSACIAFSAFVKAMLRKGEETCAIVRYCYNVRSSPKIGALIPDFNNGIARMVYVPLPYSEDYRAYTMNEAICDPPTSDQIAAIDMLITSMDLDQGKTDESGKRCEAVLPEETLNPQYQYLFQCMKQRVLYPNEPLQTPSEALLATISPTTEQLNLAKPAVKEIKKLFVLKKNVKVEKRTAAETFKSDAPPEKAMKVESSEKVDSDNFSGEKTMKISTVRPVQDFLACLAQDKAFFEIATEKLSDIIKQFVFDGVGPQLYGKAIDCLEVYRKESVKLNISGRFNRFISTFKAILIDKCKEDFWKEICKKKLGLISSEESSSSHVTKSETEEFLKEIETRADSSANASAQEAEGNILDELE